MKSTLRSQALTGYPGQVGAHCVDGCTLEALSKQDLLLLWKRTELELQAKLTDVMNRNKRLALAIDYLTKDDFGEEV